MARFTVTEQIETTYKIDGDADYIAAWRRGEIDVDDFHAFLSVGNPISQSVTERVIEED